MTLVDYWEVQEREVQEELRLARVRARRDTINERRNVMGMGKTDIEKAAESYGYVVAEWRDTDEGPEAVIEGRWQILVDDENEGLWAGDEGEVTINIVGAEKYGNERVAWSFADPGMRDPVDLADPSNIEPV